MGNVQCGLAPQAGAQAAPETALHVPPPGRPAPCSTTGSTQTIFRTSIAQNEAPGQAGSWRSSACGGARASLRPPGATDDDARASSPVSSHDHAPAAGLACGGSKLHLGSLMMTRMACSQVHSEPHLTAASSSLNASLASSCAAARARASARLGGRLHAQRGAAISKSQTLNTYTPLPGARASLSAGRALRPCRPARQLCAASRRPVTSKGPRSPDQTENCPCSHPGFQRSPTIENRAATQAGCAG